MAGWIGSSSVVSTATVRNSTADLTKLEAGAIFDSVEEQLSKEKRFSSNDIRKDAKGRIHKFSIVAEKGGAGQAGDLPGIHIGLLNEAEVANLSGNIFRSWDCFLTPVPLHVLTKNLWEDHDPNDNFINKNFWDYAQAACKNVLLLLSEQPGVTAAQKRLFVENAEEVRNSVVTKAALETTGRAAIYTGGALVAGAAIFDGVKWLMGTEHNNAGGDDSEDEK